MINLILITEINQLISVIKVVDNAKTSGLHFEIFCYYYEKILP